MNAWDTTLPWETIQRMTGTRSMSQCNYDIYKQSQHIAPDKNTIMLVGGISSFSCSTAKAHRSEFLFKSEDSSYCEDKVAKSRRGIRIILLLSSSRKFQVCGGDCVCPESRRTCMNTYNIQIRLSLWLRIWMKISQQHKFHNVNRNESEVYLI